MILIAFMLGFQLAAIVAGFVVIRRGITTEASSVGRYLASMSARLGAVENGTELAVNGAQEAAIAATLAAQYIRELRNRATELVDHQRQSDPGRRRPQSAPDLEEITPWTRGAE